MAWRWIPTSHDVWVVNQQDFTVTELSSTGSVLGTFSVGKSSLLRGGGSHQRKRVGDELLARAP